MDLVQAIKNLLTEIREAAADGRISLREAVEITVALGELLRVIGQIIPGTAQAAAEDARPPAAE